MKNFCYHSIGESLIKFESVMKNGIVSEKMAKGMDGYIKQFDGYNGSDKISVVIPHEPDKNWEKYIQADALGMFVLEGGISFKIEDCSYTSAKEVGSKTPLFDEGFVEGNIPSSKITGIIVTQKTRKKRISDLSILGVNDTENAIINVRKIMQVLMKQGIQSEEFDEIECLIPQYENAKKAYEETLKLDDIDFIKRKAEMNNIMRNIDKSPISVMDIVETYNERRLPILDENDVVQECKGLRLSPTKNTFEDSKEQSAKHDKPLEKTIEENAIQKSIIAGSFIPFKVFGLKETIEAIKQMWVNRKKTKENVEEKEGEEI